jgi:hypothetical protein
VRSLPVGNARITMPAFCNSMRISLLERAPAQRLQAVRIDRLVTGTTE